MWAPNITAAATTDSRDHDRGGTVAGRNIGRFSRNSGGTLGMRCGWAATKCRLWVKPGPSPISAQCPDSPRKRK